TIATPFRGSQEAVAITTTGNSSLNSVGSREREAARVTPALYHLLPSYEGAVKGQPANVLFDSKKWQTTIFETLRAFIERNQLPKNPPLDAEVLLSGMLAQAKAHRDAMETLVLPDSKKWLCIAGVNTKTRVGMT